MKIYTSYFAKVNKLPPDIVPISISRSIPPGYAGIEYRVLAPTPRMLDYYKEYHDEDTYKFWFQQVVLRRKTQEEVLCDLEKLSAGKDIALICYEKPGEFCHRHLVAEWLGGVEEYTF